MDYRELFDLTGRHALVIGAGSGIGAAIAAGLAGMGAHVACADVRADAAAIIADAIARQGGSASAHEVDVTNEADVDALVASLPGLDACVATPAVNVRKPLLETSVAEFDRVVRLNLLGSFVVLRAAGRRMADAGKGSIVLLSSIRAQVVEPGQGVYAPPKPARCSWCARWRPSSAPAACAPTRSRPGGRDPAHRAHQGGPRVAPRLRREVGARPLGAARRTRRPRHLPLLRRVLVRHRHAHRRRRWLDGDRRALHAAAVRGRREDAAVRGSL
jgi:NADP-dependent 3-hydroxy acid dehydrogenase YdfG